MNTHTTTIDTATTATTATTASTGTGRDGFPPPGTDPAREVEVRDTSTVERHGRLPGDLSLAPSQLRGAGACPEYVGWVAQYMAGALFSTASATGVDALSVSRDESGGWTVHLHDPSGGAGLMSADAAARYVDLLDPVRNPVSGHVLVTITDYPKPRLPFSCWRVLLDLGADDDGGGGGGGGGGQRLLVEVSVFSDLRSSCPVWLPDTSSTDGVVGGGL